VAVKRIQVVGAFLWRGGALLAVVWGLFESARWIWRLVDVPAQVELGLGLVTSGFAMLVVSLILERVEDYRAERDLQE
jgi:hypothetical protein